MPSMIQMCACGRRGILLKTTGKCIHCSKGGAKSAKMSGKPKRNNTAMYEGRQRAKPVGILKGPSTSERAADAEGMLDKGPAKQRAKTKVGRQRIKRASSPTIARAEDSDGMYKRNRKKAKARRNQHHSAGGSTLTQQKTTTRNRRGKKARARRKSAKRWGRSFVTSSGYNAFHEALNEGLNAKQRTARLEQRLRAHKPDARGAYRRGWKEAEADHDKRTAKIAAKQRNRRPSAGKILSDEIAFEKAMAAIKKANQSLKAMAIHQRQGNAAKRALAKKMALRHYDESDEWGRKIATKRLKQKITNARWSFLRSFESLNKVFGEDARVRAKRMSTQRNRRPSAGKIARCKAIIANLQRNKKPTDAELKQLYDAARKAHAAGDTTTFLKMAAVLEMFEPRPKKYSKKIAQEFGRRAGGTAKASRKPASRTPAKKRMPKRGEPVFFGGRWFRPGDREYEVRLQLAQEAAAGVEQRNRGGKKTHARKTKRRNKGGVEDPSQMPVDVLLREAKADIRRARAAGDVEYLDAAWDFASEAKRRAQTLQQRTQANEMLDDIAAIRREHPPRAPTKQSLGARAKGAAQRVGSGIKGAARRVGKALGLRNRGGATTRNSSKAALRKLCNPRSKAWD